jgi:hypothetical protein
MTRQTEEMGIVKRPVSFFLFITPEVVCVISMWH